MGHATVRQCNHWRVIRPRLNAVIMFAWLWRVECGCWPDPRDVQMIFDFGDGGYPLKLLRKAIAVLEAQA